MNVQRRRERGALSLEMAIVAPGVLVLILLLTAAGRTLSAYQAVEASAAEVARTASLARDAQTAAARAHASGSATLANQGLRCRSHRIDIDTRGFSAPIGVPADVGATVTCVVDLADLTVPGLPGAKTVTRSATSPIDAHRAR